MVTEAGKIVSALHRHHPELPSAASSTAMKYGPVEQLKVLIVVYDIIVMIRNTS